MIRLVVGCPVRDRAWVMERWFEHIAIAVHRLDATELRPHFLFVGDPRTDQDTFAEIDKQCLAFSFDRDVVEVDEQHSAVERIWNPDRYAHMVVLRNALLTRVRELAPTLFWSVDSDILVHPESLLSAMGALDRFDAVGSKTYMTPYDVVAPSFAQLTNGGLLRWEDSGCFSVDVIMAIKLMTRLAYDVDYVAHVQGEDIGWSQAARERGVKLGWDGTHASRHVMDPKYLAGVDARCGF